ncbi:MAG: FAD-dependent oxidoreductase [Candidatus Cloacimonadales bacterium]
MKKYDVVIIGGGPSGIIVGVTGKKQNPEKSFLMITEKKQGLVPCGIPYLFHDLDDVKKNQMGPKGFVDAGGDLLIDRVEKLDPARKIIQTAAGETVQYDKLVFATGSVPTIPSFIAGYDLENVLYIKKEYDYIAEVMQKTQAAKEIVVIGGGFIGVEVAEQLAKFSDKNVSLVEMEKHCLSRAFSQTTTEKSDELIVKSGVKLHCANKVERIVGQAGKVSAVQLSDGSQLPADVVIAAIGYRPNTDLAKKGGLEINANGAIQCDNYLRTNQPDIFAVGDCSSTSGFITGRTDNIMLASTATAEARILGYNLFSIKLIRNFPNTISVFSTEINKVAFASAGALEQVAAENQIDYVVGRFSDTDRHPATIADASDLCVKLVVSPGDGKIIGGEMYGGKSVGELVNVLALAIQKQVTVYEMVGFQIGTHPLLTTAPTKYVLIKAAEEAMAAIARR